MLDNLTRNDRERRAQMEQLLHDLRSIREQNAFQHEDHVGAAVDHRFAPVKL